MAGNNSNRSNRVTAEPDIPSEKIIEAAKSYETCQVRVTRVNAKNQWQSILNGDVMPVMELLNIDKYLDDLTGGGKYRVEPKNPSGVEPLYVVTPFFVSIEGQPRPKPGGGQVPVAAGMPPMQDFGGGFTGFAPQQSPAPSGWAGGLAPGQQQAYAQMQPGWQPPWRQQRGGAQGPSFASDQLAMRQVADMQAVVGKLEGKLEAEREKRETRERELENQRRTDREKYERELKETRRREEETRRAAEAQQRAEERASTQAAMQQMQLQFQQQMTAMTAQLTQAPKASPFAELAPLIATYLATSKDSAREDRASQLQMMQMQQTAAQNQQQMMITLLSKNDGADKPYLALLKEVMEQKSPETQASMISAMLDMQITTAGAMANLVKETMPEDPPVWLQAVMGGMGTIQSIANDMIEEGRAKRGPVTQAQVAPQHAQLPAPQQGLAQVELPAPVPAASPASNAPPEAQQLDAATQQKLAAAAQKVDSMAMMLPEDFRTQEWRAILIELHAQMPVERVAHLLARHLSHLMEFRGLPTGFDDFVKRPKATLSDMLQFLPVSSEAPKYARDVIETTVAYLTEEGYVGDKASQPDQEAGVPEAEAQVEVVDESAPAGRASGNGTAIEATGVVVEPPPDLGDVEVLPITATEA